MNTLNDVTLKRETFKHGWTRLFVNMLSRIEKGSIQILTPEGELFKFHGESAGHEVKLRIHNWSFCEKLFLKGDIGLGEAYIEGLWSCDHIEKLISFGVENKRPLEKFIKGSLHKILYYRVKHLLNRNTKTGSKKNILAHYDLGNNFYKLWLDKTMTYSSALFSEEGMSLKEAQEKKYESILNRLNAKPGDHILEVGCGWGGFMEFAASKGVKVTGVTISNEQYEFAKTRLSAYPELIELLLKDYRDLNSQYDHIVSIEMFEALGEEYWDKYFKKLYSLVKSGGKVVIQTITINDEDFQSYRRGTDFIQQYIFPGGMLPSPEIFRKKAEKNNFKVASQFEFGLDYGKTLRIWEEEFSNRKFEVEKLGFNKRFIRMWRFYLKYCEGGFNSKKISVFHFELNK